MVLVDSSIVLPGHIPQSFRKPGAEEKNIKKNSVYLEILY